MYDLPFCPFRSCIFRRRDGPSVGRHLLLAPVLQLRPENKILLNKGFTHNTYLTWAQLLLYYCCQLLACDHLQLVRWLP